MMSSSSNSSKNSSSTERKLAKKAFKRAIESCNGFSWDCGHIFLHGFFQPDSFFYYFWRCLSSVSGSLLSRNFSDSWIVPIHQILALSFSWVVSSTVIQSLLPLRLEEVPILQVFFPLCLLLSLPEQFLSLTAVWFHSFWRIKSFPELLYNIFDFRLFLFPE